MKENIFWCKFWVVKNFLDLLKSAGETFLSGLRGAKHFSNAFRIVFQIRFSYRFKIFSGAVSFCTCAAPTKASGHGRPHQKSWTSAPKSAFSCGPAGGEKIFDPRAFGRKGQERLQQIRTKKFMFTVVAELITELIHFEPEVCICNGN